MGAPPKIWKLVCRVIENLKEFAIKRVLKVKNLLNLRLLRCLN